MGWWKNCVPRLLVKKNKKTEEAVRNRIVYIQNRVPETLCGDGATAEKFPDNRVVSAKYTFWNFIPKNLFEQFRRIANFYFLCIAVIQMCIDSPVNPATSWLPLLFVITVTAIKQAYEDWLRHRNDKEVNSKPVEVVSQGTIKQVKSQDVQVGDIVRVQRDESFPCDLVVLSSSNAEGKCCITTANLDGETNLKVHYSPKETRHLVTAEQFSPLLGCIECQIPTADLYRFLGTLKLFADQQGHCAHVTSLAMDNLLLRGARLKDTDFVYGCAVYTGQDTKMALNSKLTSNKFSTVEKSMNAFLVLFLIVLIFEVGLCTGLKYLLESYPVLGNAWYLGKESSSSAQKVIQDLFSFLVIFNYIIPISLYVTLEMQKFVGSLFFTWDKELYCPLTDQVAICNSSDLNEELGQVQYLFTDKTGTLTENNMEFRQCSIGGLKFVEQQGRLFLAAQDDNYRFLDPVQRFTDPLEEFFVVLALCHTVRASTGTSIQQLNSILDHNGGLGCINTVFSKECADYDYQASSPDEKALVEACRRLGIIYHGEIDDVHRLTVFGQERLYRRLMVLDFDSDRKRMSTVFQFPDNSIWLFCKGAESSVVPQCANGPCDETLRHINDYAMLGLRTLAIAIRRLSLAEFDEFNQALNEARQSLSDREGEVRRVCQTMESNMTLLGATGVEDQLQDGVPETLEALRAAGIKIWVLTGDKLETAINIAYSCGHFKRGMQLLRLTKQISPASCQETLWKLRRKIWDEPLQNIGLVMDGESLAFSLREHRALLAEVCGHCSTVVCCRMSPIQKAQVVRLVKSFRDKPVTAAIGDGANDVSMIQEAHVGLGIMGKEGRQAVRCSDFAFARFKFLQRVLLVHGHWYYWRVSNLVQYFFYKNLVFIMPAVFFTYYNAYSPQPLYNSFFLTFYNIFFTSFPILIFGLLEQNFSPSQLLHNVYLYRHISSNAQMSWSQFFKWNFLALYHALTIFFGCLLLWRTDPAFYSNGQTLDFWSFGTLIYNIIIIVVNLKLLIQSRYWTPLFVISIAFSVLFFVGLTCVYCGVNLSMLGNSPTLLIYMNLFSAGPPWLALFLIVVVCLLPDLLISMWETYAAGGGVLVNQRGSPEEIIKRKLDRTISLLTQSRSGKFQVSSVAVAPSSTPAVYYIPSSTVSCV